MAWRVRHGGFEGVDLSGLLVMAVVEGDTTLGDVRAEPISGRSVIVVDEQADSRQKEALVAFVQSMAGSLVDEIVAVEVAEFAVEDGAHGLRSVRVADIASIEVRALHHDDGLCGNEDQFYPPLVELEHAHAAYTLQNEYQGSALSATWRSPGKSSAFVGTFVR